LNAIELIRVSLAGLWPAPSQVITPAPPAPTPEPAQPLEVAIGLGIAAQQDLGFPSPQWTGSLMAMVTWPRGLGIKAEVNGLGPALRLNGNYGSATVHRQHGLLGLAWTFLRRERVESFVVVSAGVAHLSGEGATTDPARAVARSGAAWSALGAAGIAARVRLVKMLWLGAELDGIATVPPLYIRVADAKPSSRFGVLANVGLQVCF
jgi:hypothetical protein